MPKTTTRRTISAGMSPTTAQIHRLPSRAPVDPLVELDVRHRTAKRRFLQMRAKSRTRHEAYERENPRPTILYGGAQRHAYKMPPALDENREAFKRNGWPFTPAAEQF
jgi:hypothetical protein